MLKQLIEYILSISNEFTYSQSDQRYLDGRFQTIGCSELYNSINTTNSRKNILKNKLNLNPRLNNAAIRHGMIFEDTTMHVCEITYNCKVVEMPGSILSRNKVNSCSPDGIGIINVDLDIACKIRNIIMKNESPYNITNKNDWKKKNIHKSISDKIGKDQPISVIALFEFKSPYSRILSNRISHNYKFQVLGGMDVLQYTNIGIFFESDIKACLEEHHWFDRRHYVKNFEMVNAWEPGTSASYPNDPTIIGYKYYFARPENSQYTLCTGSIRHYNVLYPEHPTFFRYGFEFYAIDGPYFILKDNKVSFIDKSGFDKLIPNYESLFPAEFTQKSIQQFHMDLGEKLINHLCFAYTPWKVMESNGCYYYRVPEFCNNWLPETTELIEQIRELSPLEDWEKREKINEL